jgi:Ser/Thr protein kinase RdoA (MazF antagonist)
MFHQDVNRIRSALIEHWALPEPVRLTGLPGGATAEVWRVSDGRGRGYVAKFVYGSLAEVEPGLAVPEAVQRRTGIPTGAPIRTRDGQLGVLVPSLPGERHPLALLEDVGGSPVSAESGLAPERAAELLARVHQAAPAVDVSDLEVRLRYIEDDSFEIAYPDQLWPALGAVAREIRALSDNLTWAVCYGDGPELFDRPDGRLGLIDWGGVLRAPVLYDVAIWSRGWRHDRERFLARYAEVASLPVAELAYLDRFDRLNSAHQLRFRAFRLARSADYYETTEAADENAAAVSKLAARLGVELP